MRSIETEGAKTILMLVLVVAFYLAAATGLRGAQEAGSLSLIFLLLRLARNTSSEGLLRALLSAIRK